MAESFDVFLSHNSRDKLLVEELGEQLRDRGLSVWLDKWELRPGKRWQQELVTGIQRSRSIAVCVGAEGMGPWEEPEMEVFLGRAIRGAELPVIPLLLPSAPADVELPLFLKLFTWVDLRGGLTPDGLDRLVWGITGTNPERSADQAEDGAELDEQVKQDRKPVRELPRLSGARATGRRFGKVRWIWGLALSVLSVLLTVGAWLWPLTPPMASPGPDLYAVRIQVLDPQGQPAEASRVWTSAGNEAHRLDSGWWEIQIPAAKLPVDKRVVFWAESDQSAKGRLEIQLAADANPTVEIRLERPRSVIRGRVLIDTGAGGADARVSTLDGTGATVQADADGRFELQVAVPMEQRVRLRATTQDRHAGETFCYSGRDDCTIEVKSK